MSVVVQAGLMFLARAALVESMRSGVGNWRTDFIGGVRG